MAVTFDDLWYTFQTATVPVAFRCGRTALAYRFPAAELILRKDDDLLTICTLTDLQAWILSKAAQYDLTTLSVQTVAFDTRVGG